MSPVNLTFPYVESLFNIVPSKENYKITLRMKYTQQGGLGTGLEISTKNTLTDATEGLGIWLDTSATKPFRVCDQVVNTALMLSENTFEFDFTGTTVNVYINGVHHYSSLNQRPQKIWFGNPTLTPISGQWSSFIVKEIKIE